MQTELNNRPGPVSLVKVNVGSGYQRLSMHIITYDYGHYLTPTGHVPSHFCVVTDGSPKLKVVDTSFSGTMILQSAAKSLGHLLGCEA